MSNVVEKWYEDKNNVDEMFNWNSELKDWEKSVIKGVFRPDIISSGARRKNHAPHFISGY